MQCTIYLKPRVVKVLSMKFLLPEAPRALLAQGMRRPALQAVARTLRLAVLLLAGLAGTPAARAQDAELGQPAEPVVTLEWTWIIPGAGLAERLYTGRFRYEGEAPADALRIVLPVPAGMRYLQDSATGPGVEITFSVDGGRTFAAPDALRMMSAAPGALLRTRRASAADYTHIQWLLAGEFVPGLTGLVSFRARPAILGLNWRRLDQS